MIISLKLCVRLFLRSSHIAVALEGGDLVVLPVFDESAFVILKRNKMKTLYKKGMINCIKKAFNQIFMNKEH